MAEEKEAQKENEDLKKEIKQLKEKLNLILSKFDTLPTASISKQTHAKSSIGNQGVQTDRHQDKEKTDPTQNIQKQERSDQKDQIINMIANLKEDIDNSFKSLTKQEKKIFSAIYMLEEEGPVTYALLSTKLGLSESSIRDYIMNLQKKKIPIIKDKISNKKIILKIHPELRNISTLDSLLKLR